MWQSERRWWNLRLLGLNRWWIPHEQRNGRQRHRLYFRQLQPDGVCSTKALSSYLLMALSTHFFSAFRVQSYITGDGVL